MTRQVSANNTMVRAFARFIVGTEFQDLPKNVVYQCKRSILDFCSVVLAGYRKGAITRPLIKYLREVGGKQEASIIGDGSRIPCGNAALANAAMGHALDLDDGTHTRTSASLSSQLPSLWPRKREQALKTFSQQ